MANNILKTLTTFIFKRNRMLAPAIALLLGIAPLSALATEISVSTYGALQAATDVAGAAGDVIKLTDNITDGADQLNIARDLTLNLNGKSLIIAVSSGNGIKIDGVTLTITDSSSGGKLTVTNSLSTVVSGAGAGINTSDGTLVIESGTVVATGGRYGAGIGGDRNGTSGTITISGGRVEATGGYSGAGIGGSGSGDGGNITISGSANVTATGGQGGAGIGGSGGGDGGTITISGVANVTATGGSMGAGIGGSGSGDGGTITINGVANVTATGGSMAAGIGGGGSVSTGGTITIGGFAVVTATGGGNAAGIGGGTSGAGGNITISDAANVTANAGTGDAAGIGGGFAGAAGNILIIGKDTQVNATGSGTNSADIGHSRSGAAGNVFVAIPAANLTLSSPPKTTANDVQFTANPATTTGTVTATLPTPFSQTVDLLTGLDTTGETLSVITTFGTTDNVTFALSGDYIPVTKNGTALMDPDAAMSAVAFALPPYAALKAEAARTTGTDIIMLGQNISGADKGTTMLTIARSLTLDLNGHDLEITVSSDNGIKIASGVVLTIIDSNPGANKLTVTNSLAGTSGGVGAGINTTDGKLIIESGTVEATGGYNGAGIGGGGSADGGTITISGTANVTANGGIQSAGIGGGGYFIGSGGAGGNITISGGTINATGGDRGAGIGGGLRGNSGGTITISGAANITASGGYQSAGIGGGPGGDGGNITISGTANVTANGNYSGAGIGGGDSYNGAGGAGGNITISGGTVEANSGGGSYGGAGIGGSGGLHAAAGNILITGENTAVTAKGGSGAQDIGAGINGVAGNVFVAIPEAKLTLSSPPKTTANAVQFTADPATTTGTVTAALPTPFNAAPFTAGGVYNLLTGLGTGTGAKTMSVITTLAADVTFALSGYTPVSKNGTELMTSGAAVVFAIAPTITTTSLSGSTVGMSYSETLTASGTTPITWSLDNGASLPAGLTLSGNTISGTPTTAGTATFTVKAENVAGDDTKSLSITVNPAPVIVVPNPDPAPDPTIYVTGVRLNLTTLEGKVGDDGVELVATVAPRFATDRNVRWSTSDPLVATVTHYGLVNFIGAGTAVITVITLDGDYTAECVVTVSSDTGTEGIDSALKVYFQVNTLYVSSPAAETIEVYSFSGERIFSAKKEAGEASFIVPTNQKAVIVRGSSGWTKKMGN